MLARLRHLLARLFAPAIEAAPPTEPTPDDAPPPAEDEITVLPIEDAIDLHGFQPRDIPSVVEEYLHEAHARGFTEVRLIHGRGKGVQRRVVQSILARHPLVQSFRDAPATRGGWGATIAYLAPRG